MARYSREKKKEIKVVYGYYSGSVEQVLLAARLSKSFFFSFKAEKMQRLVVCVLLVAVWISPMFLMRHLFFFAKPYCIKKRHGATLWAKAASQPEIPFHLLIFRFFLRF